MAALLGHEAALMEELSSAESGGGVGRLGLPPTTPASAAAAARRRAESAAAGTTLPSAGPAFSAAAAAKRPSLSGSLRDIQQLMDEQVRETRRGPIGVWEKAGAFFPGDRPAAPLAEKKPREGR